MSYRYIYDPVALVEYREAVEWYTERSILAAENFVLAVGDGVKAICKSPHRNRNTYADFREISLKKYPYYIVYPVDDKNMIVVITSVYHHKRNPTAKYNKDV